MQKQLMDEMSFKKITSNQALIVQDLDKSYNSMCSFMQLSNRYLPEAINNFQVGQQHIAKIRHNLDTIHKIMAKIHKKANQEKQIQTAEQQIQKSIQNLEKTQKCQQISTIGQAMNQIINQEAKDNFQLPSPTLADIQAQQKTNETTISNQLQKSQVDKLFAYYKLDNQEEISPSKQLESLSPTTKNFEQAFTLIKPTEAFTLIKPVQAFTIIKPAQAFTIIKSPQKSQSTNIDEPLI